jgi:hypothetical protein
LRKEGLGGCFRVRGVGLQGFGESVGNGVQEGEFLWVWRNGRGWGCGGDGREFELKGGGEEVWRVGLGSGLCWLGDWRRWMLLLLLEVEWRLL